MRGKQLIKQRGFTIWHFLIALAALAIIAIILIPNMFTSHIRPNVGQAKSEIRSLAVALETYYIDNCTYPPAVDESGVVVPFSTDEFTVSSGHVPWLLTTPVAHQPYIRFDPFAPKSGSYWARTYRYATDGTGYWIMASVGQDEDEDMVVEDYILSASGDIRLYLTQFGGPYVEYDPTNGTVSDGDVFRTGP